jgi:hypothetical protein
MAQSTRRLMMGAAGASGEKTYIDDVFSTYLWSGEFTGNAGTTRQMTNGVDLAGEGGLVWIKQRNQAYSTGHQLYDTVRGAGAEKELNSSTNAVEGAGNIESYGWLNSFDAGGFTTKGGSYDSDYVNKTGVTYASWTFRKQKGFFDIVEFSGNGTSSQVISHNLGSVPGCIMVKAKNAADDWKVYHRGNNGGSNPERWLVKLSTDQAASQYTEWWNNTAPTETNFTVGEWNNVSGWNYVAYIFGHDEQSYGENGDQSIIKCGTYTGNGSENNGTVVNLGWEPQWLMVKRTDGAEHWGIIDVMRGWVAHGHGDVLFPNLSNAESNDANSALPTSTGFKLHTTNNEWNGNGAKYMYMAIRRPDGLVAKPAEAGTDVFAMDTGNGSSDGPAFDSGFPVDMGLRRLPATGNDGTPSTDWATYSRLLGGVFLRANETNVEQTSTKAKWDFMTGFNKEDNNTFQAWMWKRHAGFDVVAYDGNSTPGRTVQHNLTKIPEMIWIKCRNTAESWVVGHKDLNGGTNPWEYSLRLNDNLAETDYPYFNDTAPTSTLFTLNNNGQVNGTGTNDYVAFLFASIEGISKVGSYSGTGSAVTVTTGFLPRLVIIKRADSGSNWVLLDSLRGLQTTSDSILRLNTSDAQYGSSDNVQTSSTGFTVPVGPGDFNNGDTAGRWIYYAHA